MTFKEDFKPSRVYNKLVIDAINKDIANDRSIIIPNTFDIDIKNNNKKYLCGTGRVECFDTGKIIKRYFLLLFLISISKVLGIIILLSLAISLLIASITSLL